MKKTRHIFMLLLMVVGGILLSACNSTKQTEKKEFDTILFGRYDNAPVEWLVLDETDDSMLIISKNSIVQKEFHEYRQDMTWEVSSSRKWLNEDFFEGAFNYEEKSRIIKTHLTAKDNKKYNVPGGNDTDDFVFLLSDSEATKYFTDDESRRAFNPDGSPSFWWLRSPGNVRQDAAYVTTDGSVIIFGEFCSNKLGGIRPAMYIKKASTAEMTVEPTAEPVTEPVAESVAEPAVQQTDYKQKRITISEPNSKTMSFSMEYCSLNGINYWFEDTIDHEERDKCIKKTEYIADRIYPQRIEQGDLNVYICSQKRYNATYIDKHKLYTCQEDFDSVEYIAKLILASYDKFANYGIVYGYAEYIKAELSGEKEIVREFQWDKENESSLLDLNLLCHRSEFASEKEIEAVKAIDCAFVRSYIEKNGEEALRELIQMSADTESVDSFCKILSDYYAQNGTEYFPGNVRYAYGGASYDYFAKCEYATMYIEKDWENNRLILKPDDTYMLNFLHKNYAETKAFFEINRDQMKQYQDFFAFDNYDNNLNVFFINRADGYSFYHPTHIIELSSVQSFMHEYIHSLTLRNTTKGMRFGWRVEGFARFFEYKYNYYGNLLISNYLNECALINDNIPAKKYIENIQRPLDLSLEKDYMDYQHIVSHFLDVYDPEVNEYEDGSSFIGYMITKFGEKETIDMMFPSNTITGDTYHELLAEWKTYVQTNYSEYLIDSNEKRD